MHKQSKTGNLFTSQQQAGVQPHPEKQDLSHWEDKFWISPIPPSPRLLLLSMMPHMAWDIPLASLGCVPSQLLVQPQLPPCRAVWGAEKALSLYELCSETTKTSLCHHHYFHQKSKIQPSYEPLRRKLTLSQTKTWHSLFENPLELPEKKANHNCAIK